ncbi:serine--tRNA ligase [Candidatus Dependentiae bacterium]|nr:serine--tRNA ligase [Candidatus Dependentiae bacterium]
MISLKLLREEPEKTKRLILRKEPNFDINKLIKLDKQVRNLRHQIEQLRQEKNELALKGAQNITAHIKEKSIEIGKQIKKYEKELEEIEKTFKQLYLSCPNIPQADVPVGAKDENKIVLIIGEQKNFDFEPQNHVDLNKKLDWFDFQAAAEMSGSNFVLYKNDAVKLFYALTHLMLKNNVKFGFKPILPPYLVTSEALVNSGNLPKFEGDFYKTQDDLCLIPTAEVSLTNLHKNQILNSIDLPLHYVSWTSCFRREAGGYGSSDRGLIRIHQFDKVEIYSICKPEESEKELEMMLECSQELLKELGLHYRVSLLAAQDCSFSASKTYDLEVWLPGQKEYYEISSCSNCTDFQARRAKIRYRETQDSKPELVHTLNSSSLALPRLIVAIMETYQQSNGTIDFPIILKDIMDKMW